MMLLWLLFCTFHSSFSSQLNADRRHEGQIRQHRNVPHHLCCGSENSTIASLFFLKDHLSSELKIM